MIGHSDNERDTEEHFDDEYEAHDVDYAEHEELDLNEGDEPLPWLDTDYDDDEAEGVDTGRIVGFVLLGLLALAVLIGGIWWLGQRGPDPELVADGSTIEAPEGPVKERPEDAGGKQFEGTGNVAPGVGEGQSREGRLAEGNAPRPSIDAAGSQSPPPSPSEQPTSESGGVGVQVGAFSSNASAVEGWSRLTRQTDALNGVKFRVEQGQADIGTVYRLQAIASDAAAARNLCNTLKSDGIACQVKR